MTAVGVELERPRPFGNGCGFDPTRPRLVPKIQRPTVWPLQRVGAELERIYHDPHGFPVLLRRLVRGPDPKAAKIFGNFQWRRGERLETLVSVLRFLVLHTDFVTGEIGHYDHELGRISGGLSLEYIAQGVGVSYWRAQRTLDDARAFGWMRIGQVVVDTPKGPRGRPSVRGLTVAFFLAFGYADAKALKTARAEFYRRRSEVLALRPPRATWPGAFVRDLADGSAAAPLARSPGDRVAAEGDSEERRAAFNALAWELRQRHGLAPDAARREAERLLTRNRQRGARKPT